MAMDLEYEIDDELLNCIHQPASLSDSITIADSRLSMKQKMLVSYDLLDLDGEYELVEITSENSESHYQEVEQYLATHNK